MKKKHEKPAFTLIELIIVITIIGIMVGLISLDFNSARSRQQISVLGDQSLALLQQTSAEVRSGKLQDESLLCLGAYFEEGSVPMKANSKYDIDLGECSRDIVFENYGMTPGAALIDGIEIGGTTVNDVTILFYPPEGDIIFVNGVDVLTGDAIVHLINSDDEAFKLDLNVSYLTNQISLSVPDEE